MPTNAALMSDSWPIEGRIEVHTCLAYLPLSCSNKTADLVQGSYELGFDRDLFRLCLGMKMERE